MLSPGKEKPAMFKLSKIDPVPAAIMGFGILAVVALAFVL